MRTHTQARLAHTFGRVGARLHALRHQLLHLCVDGPRRSLGPGQGVCDAGALRAGPGIATLACGAARWAALSSGIASCSLNSHWSQ